MSYVQTTWMVDESPKHTERDTDSTFLDNLRLPVHRWFRYSAGFSGQWANAVISTFTSRGSVVVLDPFVGSGTTLIASEQAGVASYGLEAHPFVARIAKAKLQYRTDLSSFERHAWRVLSRAREIEGTAAGYPDLILRIFDQDSLVALDSLRRAQVELDDGSPHSELTWLALVAILRQVSHAGTAPWQYVLPNKVKKTATDPRTAFKLMTRMMSADMLEASGVDGPSAKLLQSDARTCEGVPDSSVTLVVTSPPYPNNYDYADATRVEMSFLREVSGWGDLQERVRQHLIRSCSQHVSDSNVDLAATLESEELFPIREQISTVCQELARIRETRGGRKTYHLMIATYFLDMARTWNALRRVCVAPSTVCFVIGDSAPYGVYVPVVEWMGVLARTAGFSEYRFEKTRDRNIKWKNRKHRVPLCEGRFWVEG